MQIVLMNKSHLKEVVHLEHICFGNDAWSLKSFESELNSKHSVYVSVLDKNEKLIGYAGCRIVFDEAELVNICVDPCFRRNGVGCSILRFYYEIWKQKPVKLVFLEVRISNKSAILLYEQFGFRKISLRERYYGSEDAYIMMLDMNKV